MAVVRERRQLNLRLPLPDVSDRRPRFPLPLPPSSTASAVAASSVIIPATELERLEVLGHGNGGTVYKVQHKRTFKIYALKVVYGDGDQTARRQVFREMDILRKTDSPYIVRCYETYEKPSGDVAILMEYMDAGTLDTLLRNKGTFMELELAHITRQILKGLSYLHAHKIIHRDLKPSNILVNKKMEVKIADFGVSKMMTRTLEACNSYVGTCAYMSPERFDPDANGGNYDGFLGDIWSLGLTLMELYVGHFPFLPAGQRPDWATLMCAICFGDPPSLPPGASDEFRNFMECCLQKESSKRWTASQLLNHPFLIKHPSPASADN
ncbi:hypothetical protein J1N35_027909 [Gossypium stocksii]|uniref:mitogen-activated protein kinase kinase n=1 Tax=Gossypium stocksii TaxID=47602 RepID=A0A9D3VCQ7_9ROSI|nr:hypothetical protein J1N35_027909 [Gossypium stocksii]